MRIEEQITKLMEAADGLHKLLLAEVDALMSAGVGSPEARKLLLLAEAVEEYERLRFPIDRE